MQSQMQTNTPQPPNPQLTKALLTCGLIAGPLFTLAWLVQGATRAGYDPLRHAISSLSVGEFGWVQIVTFLLTGSLTVAFAVGLHRALRPLGVSWQPWLVALVGIGLIGAGVFVTDPLNGYPPGTPLFPIERTPQSVLHDLFGVPFFLGLPVTCFVFARFFAKQGQRGWVAYSVFSGVAMLAVFFVARLGFRPGFGTLAGLFGLLQRITVTVGWVWLGALAGYGLRRVG